MWSESSPTLDLKHDCVDFAWIWHNFFDSSGLQQAIYTKRQVISHVIKVNACHHSLHVNHLYRLWKSPPMIGVKSNIT